MLRINIRRATLILAAAAVFALPGTALAGDEGTEGEWTYNEPTPWTFDPGTRGELTPVESSPWTYEGQLKFDRDLICLLIRC